MVRRRRKAGKRTITPEQQAKMQAAKKQKKIHNQRMQVLQESGLSREMPMSRTERMLADVRTRHVHKRGRS